MAWTPSYPWDRPNTNTGNVSNAQAVDNFINQPAWKKPGTGSVSSPAAPATTTSTAPAAPAAPANPAMTDEEYLKSDSIYKGQVGALNSALNAYLADLTAQKDRYSVDYDSALRKLGFSGNSSVLDTAKWDSTQNRWEDPNGSAVGNIGWNESDPMTASGSGIINQLNDFASRGALRSSAFGRARNNLLRQLNEQLASTATTRNNAMSDFQRQEAAKKTETETGKSSAATEALARIKSGYGIN